MNRRIFLTTSLFTTAWNALAQLATKLPPPFHTPSANNRPRVIPRPNGAQLSLPSGFHIEEYASDGFERPRFMLAGPSGELLVTDSVANGKVHLLIDKNRDFRVDERKVLLSGLDRPYGLAWWKDYLYVAETTSVKRYKYDRANMTVEGGEEIFPMKDFGKGHWTRSLLFDRKGEKLYIGVGSESNVSPGEPERRAAINRVNPDGSGHELFATGVRNPIGMRWYPGTDTLWAAVQERDGLGDDLVPDYLTAIQPGGFYGWPYSYFGPNEDPRNKGLREDLVKKTIVPDVSLGAHVAVLDFIFYQGKQFPARYRGGAFLAFHGSWNRSERVGYSVHFVPFRKGKPAGPPEPFLTGWMLDPKKQEVWGRPVAVHELPDGSLLVSDDGGNKIWRVSYKG
ncbi:MAG: PQQ-dependent sugar dehydrogenase [Bryobacteraceae bacterium]|nr:PQQ-dependent sugar dehydrogenase [Bryobacteraceae bacterium]MDW8379443.1 PQQ-dependent sugar dehydrogenase [Bryobacterales bacterium]